MHRLTSLRRINTTLYQGLNFEFMRDMMPIASLVRVPYVMEVNPSFPAKTVPSSLPMPRPIPASSTWQLQATAAQAKYLARCSKP